MTQVGIRLEDKNKWERRVPLVPEQARELKEDHGIDILIQSSSIRAFTNEEYERAGATIVPDMPDTPVVFAIKEIPEEHFREGRTYAFFSHVIKGQEYNMPMLRRMMELGCNLIDYEKITDDKGRRLVFFGREAGQAGMVDTLWTLGQRLEHEGHETPFSAVKRTVEYRDLADVRTHLAEGVGERIRTDGLPEDICPLVVGFAGYGNVSQGAQDVFNELPHEEITPQELLTLREMGSSNKLLYKVVFKEEHMAAPKDPDRAFDLQDYYDHPDKYQGTFAQYVPHLTALMNCIYWDERYPRLVTKEQVKEIYGEREWPAFRVVGDISCDCGGAIETTLHCTVSDAPSYVYDPTTDGLVERQGVGHRGLAIVAVDNLPAELPRESSVSFGRSLAPFVVPIAHADYSVSFERLNLPAEVKRAVILYHGNLTPDYEYIATFL